MAGLKPALLRHAQHYRNVLSELNSRYLTGDADAVGTSFDRERVNVALAFARVSQYRHDDPELTRLAAHFPQVGAYLLSIRFTSREWLDWLEIGLEAAERADDARVAASHLGNIGVAFRRLGEHDRAESYFRRQLDRVKALGLRELEVVAMGNIGLCRWSRKDFEGSVEAFESQLELAREIGHDRGAAMALGNLGNSYADLGLSREAMQAYNAQLEVLEKLSDRQQYANAVGNIGLLLADMGRHEEAVAQLEHHLQLAGEIGDGRGELNARWGLAKSLHALGREEPAIEEAQGALATAGRLEDPMVDEIADRIHEWRSHDEEDA